MGLGALAGLASTGSRKVLGQGAFELLPRLLGGMSVLTSRVTSGRTNPKP